MPRREMIQPYSPERSRWVNQQMIRFWEQDLNDFIRWIIFCFTIYLAVRTSLYIYFDLGFPYVLLEEILLFCLVAFLFTWFDDWLMWRTFKEDFEEYYMRKMRKMAAQRKAQANKIVRSPLENVVADSKLKTSSGESQNENTQDGVKIENSSVEVEITKETEENAHEGKSTMETTGVEMTKPNEETGENVEKTKDVEETEGNVDLKMETTGDESSVLVDETRPTEPETNNKDKEDKKIVEGVALVNDPDIADWVVVEK